MTRTTGATDAPPTGPAWEPKIIGARELWAIRESFKFCDTTQISDAVLDTMVAVMDGTTDPDQWAPETRSHYPGHRIVRVDDLRMLVYVLELFAPEYTPEEQAAIDRIQAAIGEAE